MCLLVLAPALQALAQPLDAHAEAEYQRAVRDALQEYRASNFAEAYALFSRAHELRPSARTLRCLGMTSFEMRQYVRSQRELRAALDDGRQPLTREQRAELVALLHRMALYIATVEVRTKPSSANVMLDGQAIAGKISVNLGEHELSVHSEGYQPVLRKLILEGGKAQSLEIELLPLPADPEQPPAPIAQPLELTPDPLPLAAAAPASAPRDTEVWERWWFWTAIGVVVAGSVAVAVVLASEPEPRQPEQGSVPVVSAVQVRW